MPRNLNLNQLQIVKTTPDSQLLNLLSVSRLVTVLDEADQCGVVCKLQELDRGVFRCAVVGVEQRFSIPVLAHPRSAYFACLSLLTHLIQMISSLEVRSVHELCSD